MRKTKIKFDETPAKTPRAGWRSKCRRRAGQTGFITIILGRLNTLWQKANRRTRSTPSPAASPPSSTPRPAGVLETARKYPKKIGKVYAGRNGIIGALTEDLIDTSKESVAAIKRCATRPRARSAPAATN